MANYSMICHEDTPATEVRAIGVEVERKGADRIWICYQVDAPVDMLELGVPTAADRADRLWQTTCLEAFIRQPGSESYCELNFAPSSQWAAYRFDRYRDGMAELPMPTSPELSSDISETHFALTATFVLPPEFADVAIEIAVTAIVEQVDGSKSFWSLNHPPGAPDFHHPDCFMLTFPPPAQP